MRLLRTFDSKSVFLKIDFSLLVKLLFLAHLFFIATDGFALLCEDGKVQCNMAKNEADCLNPTKVLSCPKNCAPVVKKSQCTWENGQCVLSFTSSRPGAASAVGIAVKCTPQKDPKPGQPAPRHGIE